MSAEAPALVRSFRVGRRVVTLTVPQPKPESVRGMTTEWFPDRPRHLTPSELRQYRAGRDAVLAELGLRVLVVEI